MYMAHLDFDSWEGTLSLTFRISTEAHFSSAWAARYNYFPTHWRWTCSSNWQCL